MIREYLVSLALRREASSKLSDARGNYLGAKERLERAEQNALNANRRFTEASRVLDKNPAGFR